MDFSKIRNKLLIILCVFVLFTPFCLITKIYATEDTSSLIPNSISGLSVSSNKIVSSEGRTLSYIQLIKGHTYRIVNNNYNNNFTLYLSDSLEVGSDVTVVATYSTVPEGTYFDFTADNDYFLTHFVSLNILEQDVLLFDITDNMAKSVTGLVDNVGIRQIWNIFDISINYIVIVVLVVFGLFIISRIIKKISKGKEGL